LSVMCNCSQSACVRSPWVVLHGGSSYPDMLPKVLFQHRMSQNPGTLSTLKWLISGKLFQTNMITV
jgi:hypothetical protein